VVKVLCICWEIYSRYKTEQSSGCCYLTAAVTFCDMSLLTSPSVTCLCWRHLLWQISLLTLLSVTDISTDVTFSDRHLYWRHILWQISLLTSPSLTDISTDVTFSDRYLYWRHILWSLLTSPVTDISTDVTFCDRYLYWRQIDRPMTLFAIRFSSECCSFLCTFWFDFPEAPVDFTEFSAHLTG
jgi:hypothetical protein